MKSTMRKLPNATIFQWALGLVLGFTLSMRCSRSGEILTLVTRHCHCTCDQPIIIFNYLINLYLYLVLAIYAPYKTDDSRFTHGWVSVNVFTLAYIQGLFSAMRYKNMKKVYTDFT